MYFVPISRIVAAAFIAISLTGFSYASQESEATQSEIVLTVSEQDTLGTSTGGSVAFSIDMLRALPQETFETSTIWTEGTHTFMGVPLGAIIAQVVKDKSEKPTLVIATASNDYAVEIPVPHGDTLYPIIAYEMNGAPMGLRDKGPLWIVYPFDSVADFRTETIYSRSIWQVEKIELSR
jgi:hypothetical protein